jgi:D-hexose-6-phosphate mutarotase
MTEEKPWQRMVCVGKGGTAAKRKGGRTESSKFLTVGCLSKEAKKGG